MKAWTRLLSISGAISTVFSILCFARAEWIDRRLLRPVLETPIELVEGLRTEATFSLRSAGTHEVGIRFKWTVPLSEEMLAEELAINYELWEDGKLIRSGKLPPVDDLTGSHQEWLSPILCDFPGNPNGHYRIIVNVHRTSSILASTEPVLFGSLSGLVTKDLEMDAWFLGIAGWATAAIAFAFFSSAVVVVAAKRLRLKDERQLTAV